MATEDRNRCETHRNRCHHLAARLAAGVLYRGAGAVRLPLQIRGPRVSGVFWHDYRYRRRPAGARETGARRRRDPAPPCAASRATGIELILPDGGVKKRFCFQRHAQFRHFGNETRKRTGRYRYPGGRLRLAHDVSRRGGGVFGTPEHGGETGQRHQ